SRRARRSDLVLRSRRAGAARRHREADPAPHRRAWRIGCRHASASTSTSTSGGVAAGALPCQAIASLARASLCARLSSSRWLSAGEPCCDRSMAEPLKHFFSRELVRRIGRSLAEVHPKFPLRSFVRDASRGLDELELKARA